MSRMICGGRGGEDGGGLIVCCELTHFQNYSYFKSGTACVLNWLLLTWSTATLKPLLCSELHLLKAENSLDISNMFIFKALWMAFEEQM